MFGSHELVCPTTGDQNLIFLTDDMLPRLVMWCHHLTAHAEGMVWLETSMQHHCWHSNLRGEIWNQLNACDTCSMMKKNFPKEGQLAPCDVPCILWLEAHVDLIGPWKLKSQGVAAKFWGMTIIDPVTNLVEIVRVTSTKSAKNARTFKNTWLAWCPKPEKVVTDNGPEFNGNEWEFMLMDWGIWKGRISSHAPTADAVMESSHRVIGQIFRTTLHGATVKTKAELESAFNDACAIAACVMHCVSDISLQGNAPGMVAFGQDMNINIPVPTDIVAVSANRQLQTDTRLMRENQRRTLHKCEVGQQVQVNNHFSSADKLKPVWAKPFPILHVHANGTITIQRGPTHEQISVPCVEPVPA